MSQHRLILDTSSQIVTLPKASRRRLILVSADADILDNMGEFVRDGVGRRRIKGRRQAVVGGEGKSMGKTSKQQGTSRKSKEDQEDISTSP